MTTEKEKLDMQKKIRQSIKDSFLYIFSDTAYMFVEQYNEIINYLETNEKLNLYLFIKNRPKYSKDKQIEYIIKRNSKLIECISDDIILLDEITTSKIKSYLEKYREYITSNGKIILKEDNQVFENCIPFDDKNLNKYNIEEKKDKQGNYYFSYLMPSTFFNEINYWNNMVKDENIYWLFNSEIIVKPYASNENSINTAEFKIQYKLTDTMMTTTYMAVCEHIDKDFPFGCKDTVTFSDYNKKPKCRHGHNVLTTAKPMSARMKSYSVYVAIDVNDTSNNSKEIYLYIDSNFFLEASQRIRANYFCMQKDEILITILLGFEPLEEIITKPLTKPVFSLPRDKYSNVFQWQFDCIKDYHKWYTGFKLTDQNKIVGLFKLMQLNLRYYFEYISVFMLVGSSGGGKTVWQSVLTPLFTNKHMSINNTITPAQFLGGANKKENKIYADDSGNVKGVGYIYEDMLWEEFVDAINEFSGNASMKSVNNPISMLKPYMDTNKSMRGYLGAQAESKPNSCITITANMEDLLNLKNLRKDMEKALQAIGVKHKFDTNELLTRPLEYYKKVCKGVDSDKITKAIASIRRKYGKSHWILNIFDAEQSRILFNIFLEDDRQGDDYSEYNEVNTHEEPQFLHLEEIRKELNEMFIIKNDDELYNLTQEVGKYVDKEYFVYEKRLYTNLSWYTPRKVHPRFRIKLIIALGKLCWLNKCWYTNNKLDEIILNDRDKEFIDWFMLYNFNSLTQDEADGKILPKTLGMYYKTDELRDVEDDYSKYEYKERRKLDEDIIRELKETQDVEDLKDIFDVENN